MFSGIPRTTVWISGDQQVEIFPRMAHRDYQIWNTTTFQDKFIFNLNV
jgi:hypothetical protein